MGWQPFCLVEGIRLLKCVKEGVEFEITVQESRGFGVRALQGRVLAEKTAGRGFVRPPAECFPHTTRSASGTAFSQQARESEYERDQSRGLWRDARTIMNVLYRPPEGMTFEELSAYLDFGKERIAQASCGRSASLKRTTNEA